MTSNNDNKNPAFYVIILIFSILSILCFKYLPFVFVEGGALVSMHLALAYYSLLNSFHNFIAAIGNIVVGSIGILLQPYFSLHVFSYNIIHYIWLFYLGSGSINIVFYFIFLIARKIHARKNKALVESV